MLTRAGKPAIAHLILTSGGTVEVSLDVNLFRLSEQDRKFVADLIELLRGYNSEPTPSSRKVGGGHDE